MLTYRRTNVAFAVGLALMLAWHAAVRPLPWTAYALLAVLYSLVLSYGCYFIRSGFFMPTIWRGKTREKTIALTFDDGPNPQYTPAVLDILRAHGVKAAFFCIGKNAAAHPDLLRQIVREGHIIGNHSYSHAPTFALFSKEKLTDDLRQANEVLEATTGHRPRLFRPPYGILNPNLRSAIRRGGYQVVGWSFRSFDTVINDKQTLMSTLERGLEPGGIVLLHDHGKKTVEILPELIRMAGRRGYTIEPLDRIINIQPYA